MKELRHKLANMVRSNQKYNFKTYHKDISFLSGRTRSIITKYGIARTDFKKLMIHHQIPNIEKSSW